MQIELFDETEMTIESIPFGNVNMKYMGSEADALVSTWDPCLQWLILLVFYSLEDLHEMETLQEVGHELIVNWIVATQLDGYSHVVIVVRESKRT